MTYQPACLGEGGGKPASQLGQAAAAVARQPMHLHAHSYVNMTEGQYGHPMAKCMYLK